MDVDKKDAFGDPNVADTAISAATKQESSHVNATEQFLALVRSKMGANAIKEENDEGFDSDGSDASGLSVGTDYDDEDVDIDIIDAHSAFETDGIVAQEAENDLTPGAGLVLGQMWRPSSGWETVREKLQYLQRPKDPLLCREEEHESLLKLIISLLSPLDEHNNVHGGVIFLAGVPGTGKTATTRIVARIAAQKLRKEALKRMGRNTVFDLQYRAFQYVEVNAFKLSRPNMAFSYLWWVINARLKVVDWATKEAVSKVRREALLGAEAAKRQLDAYFKGEMDDTLQKQGTPRISTFLLLDEIEALMTTDQDVLYTLFEWSRLPTAKLLIIGIANMIDMADKVHQKINSRLGRNRIVFAPYQPHQLRRILEQKMKGFERYFEDASVFDYMAKKVGSSKGDARLMFEVCSRSLRFSELHSLAIDPSGDTIVPVSSKIVDQALFAMRDNARLVALQSVSLHDRIFVMAVLFEIGSRRRWRAQVTEAQREVISHSALLQLDDDVTYLNVACERYTSFATFLHQRPLPTSAMQAVALRCFQGAIFAAPAPQDRSLLRAITLKLDPEAIFNAFYSDSRLKPLFIAHNFGAMFDVEISEIQPTSIAL